MTELLKKMKYLYAKLKYATNHINLLVYYYVAGINIFLPDTMLGISFSVQDVLLI